MTEETLRQWKADSTTGENFAAYGFLASHDKKILALIEEVRKLQKENEGIVDDALKCTQLCDAYSERLKSAESALRFFVFESGIEQTDDRISWFRIQVDRNGFKEAREHFSKYEDEALLAMAEEVKNEPEVDFPEL